MKQPEDNQFEFGGAGSARQSARRTLGEFDAAMRPPRFSQEPHAQHSPALRDRRHSLLLSAIGREVRAQRLRQELTITEVATNAAISPGMLSKMENGLISASLSTLRAVAAALNVSLSDLFRPFEEKATALLVKAGQRSNVEARGFRKANHSPLGHLQSNGGGVMESFLVSLASPEDVVPAVQHEGQEVVFMLEGEIVYRHGANLYRMGPGDSLFFDADTLHGPHELITRQSRYLSIVSNLRKREN